MNEKFIRSKYLCVFVASVLMVCVFGVSRSHADTGDLLKVFKNKKMLYAGPSEIASRLVSLKLGEQMVEMDRQGGWIFVALKSSGEQGWVKASVVHKSRHKMIRMQQKRVNHKKIKDKRVKQRKNRSKSRMKVRKAQSRSSVVLKDVVEPKAVKPEFPVVVRQISLKGIGFQKGFIFEGAGSSHAKTFFLPAPFDSKITNGTFRLFFRASPGLRKISDIRVMINDIPYKQMRLPADGFVHELDVLLPASGFKGPLVKITINTTLLVSDNRCSDERLSDTFLHVLPNTSLTISYQSAEKSIRDAWRMLPEDVTISLSKGALSKAQFASTLAVMSMLMKKGKKVKFTRLPDIGDIVVAPKSSIERMLNQKLLKKGKAAKGMSKALDHVSNLSLIRLSDRTVILLTDPYDVQPMYLLNDTWKLLAAGNRYRIFRPDNLNARHSYLADMNGKGGYYSLPLSRLGMNMDVRYIRREVSWQTVINPFTLPVGTQIDFMNLNIVAPVRWENDPTYALYVFLNDVLVKSARLENTGLKQHFTVNLPSEYQKQFNHVRVVVQHDIESGNCKGVMPYDFVQIMPDSTVVVKKASSSTPEKFSDLSRYFQTGFDTYMESSYLNSPEQALYLMARLASDIPLVIDYSRLHILNAGDTLKPEHPFIAVGDFALGDIDAPVRFDKGRVKIVAPNGESYFDVNQLSKVTVAEIVEAPSSYGLWVRPSESINQSMTERLNLSEGDVAFIDSQGVIKTLNASESSIARIYYPDVEDWFDVMGKYRYWMMVLLWFLLTMVVVYLYRMSRKNKLAREDDDKHYQAEEKSRRDSYATHLDEDSGVSLNHPDERR